MERRRVLIVDDDVELVDFLRDRLEHEGYEVAAAYDGESGLGLVGVFRPHVVLLDLYLPGLNGVEVLKRLRESESRIVVVVITAYGDGKLGEEARKIGPDEILQKPVDVARIKKTLQKAKF